MGNGESPQHTEAEVADKADGKAELVLVLKGERLERSKTVRIAVGQRSKKRSPTHVARVLGVVVAAAGLP